MTVIVRAEFEVQPEHVEAFRDVALALAAAASREPGTLKYAWYTADRPSTFVVVEEYTDDAAALAHNENCAELLRRVGELAEMTAVHVHGVLGPELERWVAEHPQAHAHPPL